MSGGGTSRITKIIDFLTMEGPFWRKQKTPKTRTRVHLTFEEYQKIRGALHAATTVIGGTGFVQYQCRDAGAILEVARWRTEEERDG